MSNTTNEWFVFGAGTVDKKTCNKIKKWASKKWQPSAVDISKELTDEELQKHRYNFKSANPRCPNTECDFHKEAPPAKLAFIISVVEEGLMGKIFKSEAYGIVSCKLCGEVIGVGGKG